MIIDLSIIIVNYNTLDLTTQCIKSVIQETQTVLYEIIVVDNASNEFQPELVKALSNKIKIIENKENLGFGIANNQGMKAAKGEFILLLNSDTIIIDNAIDKSVKYLTANKTAIDVITCKQLNQNNKPFVPKSFYFKRHTIFQYLLQNPFFELLKSKLVSTSTSYISDNTFVENVSGAFMLFNKKVFTSTQGFDPDFFIYYEETEWCVRLKQKRFKLFYLNDVAFIHLHGKSSPRLIMQEQMHLSGGLYWYKKGKGNYFLFLLISYFIYLPMWLLLSVLSVKFTTRKHFNKYAKIYNKLLPYFLKNILKYKNNFDSRKQSLKLNELAT